MVPFTSGLAILDVRAAVVEPSSHIDDQDAPVGVFQHITGMRIMAQHFEKTRARRLARSRRPLSARADGPCAR